MHADAGAVQVRRKPIVNIWHNLRRNCTYVEQSGPGSPIVRIWHNLRRNCTYAAQSPPSKNRASSAPAPPCKNRAKHTTTTLLGC